MFSCKTITYILFKISIILFCWFLSKYGCIGIENICLETFSDFGKSPYTLIFSLQFVNVKAACNKSYLEYFC